MDKDIKKINADAAAARELEAQAGDIAIAAREHFLREHVHTNGDDSEDNWEQHFRQRILELAAAMAAGESMLFTARVLWSRQAMRARLQESKTLGASLRSLRSALAENLPKHLADDALSCIDAALDEFNRDLPATQVSQLDPTRPLQRLALLYLQAALEGNVRHAIEMVLDAIDEGLSPQDAITKVLLPAQSEIGHLWHLDHVTVAEEHLVTTTTQRLMAIIVHQAPHAPDRGLTAVAASVAGNPHEMGIRAIAYLLELDGWRSIYLGSDVPRDNLPAAVHFFDADIALLSVALSSQLTRLGDTIAAIRSKADSGVRIMVGGNAFSDTPDIWEKLGADAYAQNADEALRVAAELLGQGEQHITHH